MFPFYGWGGFQIRLARRRAHPCDEQVVATICSFCLYMHVKVSDSILWVGPAVGMCRSTVGGSRRVSAPREGSDQRRGRGDQQRLYKYNGNLLQFSRQRLFGSVAGGPNFCGRNVFVRMRKRKICRRKFALSADGRNRTVTKRKLLLQSQHRTHLSRLCGDLKGQRCYRLCVMLTQKQISFIAISAGRD